MAAVGALAAVLENDAASVMRPLLGDDDARVKLAAARALADRGDRACLTTLVDLLSAPDVRVRHGSASLLRALTGQSSEFAAWLEPRTQEAPIREWRQWVAQSAATATLHYPVRGAEPETGRTLLCLYSRNEVVELDAAGRRTFTVSEPAGARGPRRAWPAAGGSSRSTRPTRSSSTAPTATSASASPCPAGR